MAVAHPTHRRPGGTLYRYLVWEMVFPTLFALGGLTLTVLTKDLLGYSDLVINRGLGISTVGSMAFYQLVPLVARTLPFAVLVGCLIAFGRLGADREILILEASGVSTPRLVAPVLWFAGAMTAIGFALTLYASPWANRALDESLAELARRTPGATIVAGQIQRFGGWRLEAREASSGGDRLRGVALWMPDIGETVFAEHGFLDADRRGGTRVTLERGVLIPDPRERTRLVRFDRMTANLPGGDQPIARDEPDQLGGATISELVSGNGDRPASLVIEADSELHRRFSLPVATLVFGALVVPLFLSRAHFSRSGGGVLGVLVTIAYYGLVQLSQGLIQAGRTGAALGVWLPNIAFAVLAVGMLLRLTRLSAFGRHSDRPHSSSGTGEAKVTKVRLHRMALQRYVAGRFLELAALCFGVLLVAYLLVDVLERLQMFARYSATGSEVIRYYGARIPLLASRVVPMALLVATALTVSLLAAQGELMGMRASGIPAPRALLPILVICLLIAPAYFVLNNEVLPRTNALQAHVKQTEIKGYGPVRRSAGVWYRDGSALYEAERLDPQAGTARNIIVYELDEDGLPRSRSDARSAWHIGGGVWRLVDPLRVEVEGAEVRAVPAAPFAELGQDLPAEVDTRHLSVGELRSAIGEVEESGYDATAYRVDLYVKLASPIACLVLPALALFFAVGGPPHPSSAATLVLSLLVSVSYVLLTGVGTSLGYGGAMPPIVAGLAPTGLFAIAAAYYGLRLRGFWQRS